MTACHHADRAPVATLGAPRRAAPRRRCRADSRDRCPAWDWRSHTPDTDRRTWVAGSLALLRLPAVAEATEQAAQQKGSLRAVENGDETLVHRRIGDERAQRPFTLVDLCGDFLEVGERGLQIARGLPNAGVGRLVLDELAEGALAADQAVGDLPEIVGD